MVSKHVKALKPCSAAPEVGPNSSKSLAPELYRSSQYQHHPHPHRQAGKKGRRSRWVRGPRQSVMGPWLLSEKAKQPPISLAFLQVCNYLSMPQSLAHHHQRGTHTWHSPCIATLTCTRSGAPPAWLPAFLPPSAGTTYCKHCICKPW